VAFSESLAGRIRGSLAQTPGIAEKKLFGGVGFMLHGNLLVCVWKHSLIVRLGAEEGEAALRESHVREFDVTGRPMKGWVMVEPEGVENDDQLNGWIERAIMFVRTLPAK
jgi:TfoX/Sxy family transcriptional regulator of competence genes